MTVDPNEEARRRRNRDDRNDVFADAAPWILGFLAVALLAVGALQLATGFISSLWNFGGSTTEVTGTDVGEVSSIEVTLDCEERIEATVPVSIRHQPEAFGLGIPGTALEIELEVVGQLLTCLHEGAVKDVDQLSDDTYKVTIDTSKVEFQPAAIDALASGKSIADEKGFLRDWLEIVPLVNLNNELTPEAYAYAQVVVDVECVPASWEVTQDVIIGAMQETYADQLGVDKDDIIVVFDGEPVFNSPDIPEEILDGVEAEVIDERARCYTAAGGIDQAPTVTQ